MSDISRQLCKLGLTKAERDVEVVSQYPSLSSSPSSFCMYLQHASRQTEKKTRWLTNGRSFIRLSGIQRACVYVCVRRVRPAELGNIPIAWYVEGS